MQILFTSPEIYVIILIILILFCISIVYFIFIFKKSKFCITLLNDDIHSLEKDIEELESNKNELIKKLDVLKDEIIELHKEKKQKVEEYNNIIKQLNNEKKKYEITLNDKIEEYKKIDKETIKLQHLKKQAQEIDKKILKWEEIKSLYIEDKEKLQNLQSKIDLYSRIDEFIEYGFFENPQFLYETSERFTVEIRNIREKQKILIRNNQAVTGPENPYLGNFHILGKASNEQKKLVLRSFNIECDFLISKVSPANFERTIKRIVDIANSLEKQMIDLRFGISEEYISLKIEECKLQYQYALLKKEEIEEQRRIKEQIREEQRAQKEYEREILLAEHEEKTYKKLLERAIEDAKYAQGKELEQAKLQVKHLKIQLAEAIKKAERAKSMAEQTKQGHVYIISNIGSFGEDIYKIGLTRRLDPMERVRELGDASVPFSFDVHAMIASEDAPALERALHKAFDDKRVNAVNFRKEFFHITLQEIYNKTIELTGKDNDFIMTVLAEEYYQTQRLRKKSITND